MMENKDDTVRAPKLWEALIPLTALIVFLAVGILVCGADPHVPMILGTAAAAAMAKRLGFSWDKIEKMMISGISRSLQSVMILLIIGVMIGVWLDSGTVPSMICYGLKILKPRFFLVASVLICSVTSVATGSSWGTMGTIGVALMGIGAGLGVNPAMTAGAIISGAYFGDKASPMSDTTNLAAAMSGTDIVTHIKFMLPATGINYIITLAVFFFLGNSQTLAAGADMSSVQQISAAIEGSFRISPLLLLPIPVVIAAIALKVPAIPGLFLGAVSGAGLGLLLQENCSLSTLLSCGLYGYESCTGIETIDSLLSTGGIMNMMYAVSMIVIAMAFSGIMTASGSLTVIVDALKKKLIRGPVSLVALTEFTCILTNIVMPDQYIAIVVPGSMYAEEYEKMKLHPVVLSNSLDDSGAVTSALVPWNTCGMYISGVLGLSAVQYGIYAVFNWTMPLTALLLSLTGLTLCGEDGVRFIRRKKKKK